MKLEAEGQRAIDDPQRNDIESAVTGLSLPDHTFLILGRSEQSYVQVAIVDSNRLVIECRDSPAGQHLRSVRDDFSTREVVEILEAYRFGKDSWRRGQEWRSVDAPGRPDIWERVSVLSAIGGGILVLDSASTFRRGGVDPLLGLEPMDVLAIAFVTFMVSAVIDLRDFRTMSPRRKARAISSFGVGLPIVTIQLIEHLTAR